MNGRRGPWLALGAAAALALVYWGWVMKLKPRREKAAEDAKLLFQGLDAGSTREILLRKKGSLDVLLRKVDGQWRLITPTAAPADAIAVSNLVSQLAQAKRNEIVVDKGADLRDFGLDQPSGEVTFKPASPGAKASVLFFGLNSPAGDQAYALVDGRPEVFLTYLSVKDSVLKDASELRDKAVWNLNSQDIEAVRSELGKFDVARNRTGQWQVATATRHEPGKGPIIDAWLGELSRLRADSVPSETGQGDFGLKGAEGLRLTLKNGAQFTLIEGGKVKPGAGVYVQQAGQGPVFLLPAYAVSTLEKSAQDLMDLNVFSFDTGSVKRVEIARPLGTLVAVNTAGAWAWEPARMAKPGEKPFDFTGFLSSMANAQLISRLDAQKDNPLTPTATVTFFGDNGVLLEKAVFGARRPQGLVASSAMKTQTVLAAENLLDSLPPDAAAAAAVLVSGPKTLTATAHP